MPISKKEKHCKVVLIGDSSVGKSSINHWFFNKRHNDYISSTIGAQYSCYQANINGQIVFFDIWDTAGQERYRSLVKMYYRDADICLLVFNVANYKIADLEYWINEFNKYSYRNDYGLDETGTGQTTRKTIMLLIGNKLDLFPDFKIDAELREFIQNHQLHFFLTSAFDGTNLEKVFDWFCRKYLELESENNTLTMGNKKEETGILNLLAEYNRKIFANIFRC